MAMQEGLVTLFNNCFWRVSEHRLLPRWFGSSTHKDGDVEFVITEGIVWAPTVGYPVFSRLELRAF